jgi:hypothetical protein
VAARNKCIGKPALFDILSLINENGRGGCTRYEARGSIVAEETRHVNHVMNEA